jgi:hypothetical protein
MVGDQLLKDEFWNVGGGCKTTPSKQYAYYWKPLKQSNMAIKKLGRG